MKSYLLVFFLIFISCDKSFKAPKPEVLLEESVMEEVLYDISLLKAAKSKNYKILKDNNVKADVYIYNKYKIDSVTLRQNIAYYATNSFKTAKQIEERIKLKFEDQKAKTEINIGDSIKSINLKENILDKDSNVAKNLSDNLILSDDFNNWRYVHSFFNKDKGIVDGKELNVIKLIPKSVNYQHRVDIPTHVLTGEYQFSILAKKSEMNFVGLRIGLKGYPIIFDLENGSVHGNQDLVEAKIIKKELNWYKCSIKCNVSDVSLVRVNVFISKSVRHFVGDDLKGVFLAEFDLKEIN